MFAAVNPGLTGSSAFASAYAKALAQASSTNPSAAAQAIAVASARAIPHHLLLLVHLGLHAWPC